MRKALAGAGVVAVALVSGIAATSQERITVKGSDTMVILAQRWAEEFMKKTPEVAVQVTGGGSGTGFAALINGTTDICNASRPIKDKEVASLKEKYGKGPVEIKSAIDGIAIFVNEANPVKELTVAQLKGIYTGAISNWKEVGGQDAKIITYGRENSSGTFEFFREHVLQGADYAPSVQSLPGTAALVNSVVKDKQGIGYGGAAYAKGITMIAVKKDDKSTAVQPTAETVKAGTYPITRFLYMYTRSTPEGAAKKYIDWALSDAGQKIVSEVGYFPLR